MTTDAPLAVDDGWLYQIQVCRRSIAGGAWVHVCTPQEWPQTPIARLAALTQRWHRESEAHTQTRQQLLAAEATIELLRAESQAPAADETALAAWETERARLRAEIERMVAAHAELLAAQRQTPAEPQLLSALRILPAEEAAPAEPEPLPFDEAPAAPEPPKAPPLRYPCPHCSRTFYRPGALASHVAHMHASADATSYPCQLPGCDATFGSAVGAAMHYTKVHRHSKAASTSEGQALKATLDEAALEAREHQAERAFVCAECGSSAHAASIGNPTICGNCATKTRRNGHTAAALA